MHTQWTSRPTSSQITKSLIGRLTGDRQSLDLQYRDIAYMSLTAADFPIARLWQQDWRDAFLSMIANSEAQPDRPWNANPEISEGKTVRQMITSLLSEPIRRPIELAIYHGVGVFLHVNGYNRVGATLLRGRTVIPARAAIFLWRDGDYPGDGLVRDTWGDLVHLGSNDAVYS
jgi:hypothetical protein